MNAEFDDPSPAYTPTAASWLPNLYGGRRLPNLPRHFASRSTDSTSSTSSVDVQKIIHTYNVTVGFAELQFNITIEPAQGHPGHHLFFLTLKTGPVERPLCQPIAMKLQVDPRNLTFSVFLFPPKTSLPQGCLWSLRVWLRANEIDHRLFSDERLWVGRDPDFYSIENASFARQRETRPDMQVYKTVLGRVLIDLIVRWRSISSKVYSLSLEYDANGDQLCHVHNTHLIQSPRASHRLRVWLRVPAPAVATPTSGNTRSQICHRIWSSDDFKIGHLLDFSSLGSKMIMGVPASSPRTQTSISEQSLYQNDHKRDPNASPTDYTNDRKEAM
ncbi:hypothetical protein EVG20_g3255 [Dentipellis fragilis]|uniref:Uncharacterized protein n=1 Tax=Dentipellis fragilis TaxID=205917 RepID=A0A4Y9Z574_9AGAM|nr:hypothetical protein EVG20_g3255 [Dentipellis fragilis]